MPNKKGYLAQLPGLSFPASGAGLAIPAGPGWTRFGSPILVPNVSEIRFYLEFIPGGANPIDVHVEVSGIEDAKDFYAKVNITTGVLSFTSIDPATGLVDNRASIKRGVTGAGRIQLLLRRTGGAPFLTKAGFITW